MGGYRTWSRVDYPAAPFNSFYAKNTNSLYGSLYDVHGRLWLESNTNSWTLPSQVTTSWRTSRGAPDGPTDGGEVLDSEPSTLAGEFDFLKKVEKSDSFGSSKFDNGHTFSTVSHSMELSHPYEQLDSGLGQTWKGPLVPVDVFRAGTWPTIGDQQAADVNRWGGIAISATSPTAPSAQLGVALLEGLIDGLPKLPGEIFHTGESFLRNLAHGHLGVQFDWLPFIGDLRAAINAMLHASRMMRQYQRDSGREVRRSFTFPKKRLLEQNLLSFSTAVGFPAPVSSGATSQLSQSANGGTTVKTLVSEQEVYFKGAYTYYLPPRNSTWAAIDVFEEKANHLLGLELTPETLWELAPWSWLIDWKFHVGSLLKTYSSFATDGLVLRYGYLMVKTTKRNTIMIDKYQFRYKGTWRTVNSVAVTYITTRKERFRATPYGFGMDPASFNTRQWSILGALGMTRSPSKLRVDN